MPSNKLALQIVLLSALTTAIIFRFAPITEVVTGS